MHDLLMSKIREQFDGITTVTTYTNDIKYIISGQIGQRHDKLTIYDQSYDPLAEINQVSSGILPRFILTNQQQTVGSIGLSLKLHELLFVNNLNWLVLGSLEKRRFQIKTVRQQLATANPIRDQRLSIHIAKTNQEPLLLLIIAFLDRWQFIAHGHPLARPSIFNAPAPTLTPFINSNSLKYLPKE